MINTPKAMLTKNAFQRMLTDFFSREAFPFFFAVFFSMN